MNILTNIVARILFVVPFALIGLGHFANADSMAEMMIPNLPGATIIVYITGVALLAASVSILIKKMTSLATLLLGVFLLATAFAIHLGNMMSEDEATAMMGSVNFFKDIGLAGAAFFMSGVFKKEENS